MKPFSRGTTTALKMIYNQIGNYYDLYYSVVKALSVIVTINKSHSRDKTISMSTFDISALNIATSQKLSLSQT